MTSEGNRPRRDRLLALAGEGWASGPVAVAIGRRARLAGLAPVSGPIGLLLRTTTIHTIGMRQRLGVASLGPRGRVRRTVALAPGRLFVDLGAYWILELPPVAGLPKAGDRLRVRPILDWWPEH